jgi:hypothetical protein
MSGVMLLDELMTVQSHQYDGQKFSWSLEANLKFPKDTIYLAWSTM